MFRRMLIASTIVGLCLGLLQSVAVPATLAAQGTPAATPCAFDTKDAITAIVTDFNDAYNAHDARAMAALASPDLVRHSPRGDTQGADAMADAFEAFFAIFPDTATTTNLVLVDGSLAVAHDPSTGTQTTSFKDVEPTGATATWDGILMFHITCGKIDELWSRADQLAQLNQAAPALATPMAATDEATPGQCAELTHQAAQALMDTWYSDVWSGNFDALATITTPGVYHHWAVGPDSSGQDDQLAHLQQTVGAMTGLSTTYDAMVVDGDYIAVHWAQTLGDDSWDVLNIFRTECGLIDEVWSELDLATLPAQAQPATPTV
jgi:predicted SnoaL-like aldol condensation-catalyzing enzyme